MIIFYIKEAFKLIGRSKAAFLLSVLASSLSLSLIILTILILIASSGFQSRLKQNIQISVYLKENLSSAEKDDITTILKEMNYFEAINYISKDKAAERFLQETGEDFRQILDYNPLPESYELRVAEDNVSEGKLAEIKTKLLLLEGVDEISFNERLTSRILNILYTSRQAIFGITIFLFLISIYIIGSTNRLLISRKYEELETMKLVGARLFSIKAPIYINSIIVGFLSSSLVFSALLILKKTELGEIYLHQFSLNNYFLIPILILILGPGLSTLVTIFSLKKVTLKI